MKLATLLPGVLLFAATTPAQLGELRTFSNSNGETLEDRILKYDYEEQTVFLEENGRVPLDTFSANDQNYILQWNQIDGFLSPMHFKADIKKDIWARMKHEQTITPYHMDAIQIPGKTVPVHEVVMLEDYEEYSAIYLEAAGYTVTLRNQNVFPLENILVQSKVFYEQEHYVLPDNIFKSFDNEYDDIVTTNKVRFLAESIPAIIPREEVVLHSECALLVDQQLERSALVVTFTEEGEEDEEDTETILTGGDISDHSRRRKGKTLGVWFRVGIEGFDGKMIWREFTEPRSLPDKVSWEPVKLAADPPEAVE